MFAVDEWDDGEDEAFVGLVLDVEEGGVETALVALGGGIDFDDVAGAELGGGSAAGGDDVFDDDVAVFLVVFVDGDGAGDDAFGEDIGGSEGACVDDAEAAFDVDWAVVLVVGEVGAAEVAVFLGEVVRGEAVEGLVEFGLVEGLAAGDVFFGEAFEALEFIETFEDGVVHGLFRMGEDHDGEEP